MILTVILGKKSYGKKWGTYVCLFLGAMCVGNIRADMHVTFDMQAVMARQGPVHNELIHAQGNGAPLLKPQEKSKQLDLSKVNSSTEKPVFSFQVLEEDLKKLEELIVTMRQHISELKQAAASIPRPTQTGVPSGAPQGEVKKQPDAQGPAQGSLQTDGHADVQAAGPSGVPVVGTTGSQPVINISGQEKTDTSEKEKLEEKSISSGQKSSDIQNKNQDKKSEGLPSSPEVNPVPGSVPVH